jgi:hypothetical protein
MLHAFAPQPVDDPSQLMQIPPVLDQVSRQATLFGNPQLTPLATHQFRGRPTA